MKALVATLVFAVSLPAGAQVFKCKEGSTTVFSAQPCGTNPQPVVVRPASGPGPQPIPYYRRKADELIIGMPSEHAETMWGKPNSINRTTNTGGVTEQWVYRDGYVTKYLYFMNGRLRSIQD